MGRVRFFLLCFRFCVWVCLARVLVSLSQLGFNNSSNSNHNNNSKTKKRRKQCRSSTFERADALSSGPRNHVDAPSRNQPTPVKSLAKRICCTTETHAHTLTHKTQISRHTITQTTPGPLRQNRPRPSYHTKLQTSTHRLGFFICRCPDTSLQPPVQASSLSRGQDQKQRRQEQQDKQSNPGAAVFTAPGQDQNRLATGATRLKTAREAT